MTGTGRQPTLSAADFRVAARHEWTPPDCALCGAHVPVRALVPTVNDGADALCDACCRRHHQAMIEVIEAHERGGLAS